MAQNYGVPAALAMDTPKVAGLIVLGALVFLFAVHRGFGGLVVEIGD